MNRAKRYLIAVVIFFAVIPGGFFYLRYEMYYSHGTLTQNKIFKIEKGQGNGEIAENLEKEGLISGKYFFWFYLKTHGMLNKIYPGEYLLSGKLTIPEIAVIVTNAQKTYEKVLFTEGITMKQMAEELSKHGFEGKAFLELAKNPPQEILSSFAVLSDLPKGAGLEGYLFPDTYYFSKEATPEGILRKILDNTENKITKEMREKIKTEKKSIFEIMTMASLIEKEVSTEEDRRIVSGIFWNRISIGQALQSDATLSYILEDKKSQHSIEETKIDSLYNSYKNTGLPPGPISNPGISAISAALNPKDTDYNYFLNAKDGKTVFSKTFEEHVANKGKYGL